MKNKPTRHKETNTFKFKRFSERVSEIDVDVFHRVAHRYEEQNADELETFFHQTLQKWNVLNLTEGYMAFKKEVRNIVTLPQLLNCKRHVIDVLIKYLGQSDNRPYLEPILDLIVAVARDLRKEFYEYFPDFLSMIIHLLDIKDAEQLELAFKTLAYLFKYLWRYLIKNVDKTFHLLLPLLNESRPTYINNFAAESFAFVVRKVRDRGSFFRLVLTTLEDKNQSIAGCGRLMFEVIAGTSGQFHSCAETMLNIYLEALEDATIDEKLVYQVLETIFDAILTNIDPQKCDVFWNVVLSFLDRQISKKEAVLPALDENKRENNAQLYFGLVRHVIDHRNGRMLTNPSLLVKKLVRAIEYYEENGDEKKETLGTVIDLSVSIILASSVKLDQETSSDLVLKLLAIKHHDSKLGLIERLVCGSSDYSLFETLVLPHVLRLIIGQDFVESTLRLCAVIVNSRSQACLSGIGLKKWKKYPLDFRRATSETFKFLFETLEKASTIDVNDNLENAIMTVMIMPHFNPVSDEFVEALKKLITSTFEKLVDGNIKSPEKAEKLNFLLLLATESLSHVLNPDDFHDFMTVIIGESLLNLLKKYPESSVTLRIVDVVFTRISESRTDFFNIERFNDINDLLAAKLSSPFHEIRLITVHIYSLFRDLENMAISQQNIKNALELMFIAENEPASVEKYRDRLVHLRALTLQSQANFPSIYQHLPLRYLLGNLWINFSLLWDPVCKAIATYATKDCPDFWPIFLNELKTEEEPKITTLMKLSDLFHRDVIVTLIKKSFFTEDEKPDRANYKLLLWKCMEDFTEFCEARNRDITGLFILNVENNYSRSDSENARSWSIMKTEKTAKLTIDDEEDVKIAKKFGTGTSIGTKLLLAQMKVFARMNNPKTLYRESEMKKLYMDLLTSKNVDVQRAALDCLLAYKPKYLVAYKENLYGLIDEKNLKNELARFRIDDDSEMLKKEDRDGLMPILMRLVYAKMIMKVGGSSKGGGNKGVVRRKIILRFLAGSNENEMMLFTRMAFKPFEKFVSLDLADPQINITKLVDDVIANIDLSNVIPPKRLRSAVNLLSIVMEQFGGKMMDNLLPRLLGILLCIMTQANEIIGKSENVLSGYLPTIKNLRTSCLNILARFFAHFEQYPWTSDELDAVFNVGIFPLLEKLPIEGIHSPTALLKLIAAWTENPRYYKLLVKHQIDDLTLTPLPYVMKLLLVPKTHQSVINVILEMLLKMLTLRDVDDKMEIDEEPAKPLPEMTNILSTSLTNDLNYGSMILMPHVADILQYMKTKLQRSSRGINRTELLILSRLSELAKDAETSDRLLTLLLPILVKRSIRSGIGSGDSEETIHQLLSTIVNLVKNIEKPDIHLRAVIPLLSTISAVPARKLLLRLIETIASASENAAISVDDANLLVKLNAWDEKWIEQPNFEKRLDAFGEISKLELSSLSLDFGVAVLHTCYFFLSHETDLSLRNCSGQCLRTIGPKLAKISKDKNTERLYLMEETIFSLIKRGIRSKSDVVRAESVGFLGEMSLECPDVHPILRDLSVLGNREDREVDFFENLEHLQLHRRARALIKFCTLAKTFEKLPNTRTLTQFIYPIASLYLCNESYANKNSIIDAAIDTVGMICRFLPWHHYEIILKHYLDKLMGASNVQFHRQIVRIIVAILDAFHYDLSKLANNNLDHQMITIVEETTTDIADCPNDATEEQILEEALDNDLDPEKLLDAEKSNELMDRQTILSPYAARKLVFGITHVLLPKLHRAIIARTQHENSHKVNRRKFGTKGDREDEELMRVPIALAMVKLLQKLPEGILQKNLPGIFVKLCTFLKSRLDSVRRTTREILQKIMITLGPDYLNHLLWEMNSLLTKGFQIHVLAYTIHAVLVTLKPHLKETHTRNNLQGILSVCKIDLFGASAEEKDVVAIAKSVTEARSTKSYDIFGILAECIPESCLLDLIVPLKETLGKARSHKTVVKVTECLRHIVLGLADNSFIPLERILVFLYGIVSESIPAISVQTNKLNEEAGKVTPKTKKSTVPDCFIIMPEPKTRMGIGMTAKMSNDTNAHVMMEFALKLCHILLKREKIVGAQFGIYLDPFVPFLVNCLDARRVKLTTLALQCLNRIFRMNLPTVRETLPEICSSMFSILHKFAAAGLSKGDNFDLVMACFKCMSVLVRDVKYFEMTADQTKALVLYAEQDLHDGDKRATAFNLLKAIISRKLMVDEMHVVMEKVATLSITSDLDHVRQQSRSVFYSFLMEYPLGKLLDKHMSFYLSQLSYELKPGRLSALEMIHAIVTGFPVEVLVKQSGILFLMVGVRLINDDDPDCRKLCAKCIKETITRVPHNQRIKLFDIVKLWLKDPKITHRTLAAQLCGIFVSVEKESFEPRLTEVLPLILRQFDPEDSSTPLNEPGRFVKLTRVKNIPLVDIKDPERMSDHHLFQVLQLSLKISANCPSLLKNDKYEDSVASLAAQGQSLLAHPHSWVRLAATQLIGFVLSALNEEKIQRLIENPESSHDNEKGYLYSNPLETIKSLSLDLVAQLQPNTELEELANQVVKNLVCLARLMTSRGIVERKNASRINGDVEVDDDDDGDDVNDDDKEKLARNSDISILWLLRRMRKSINVEVSQAPKSTCVRVAVFKWIAGILATIPMEHLRNILFQIMSPLVREMSTTEETNAPLRHLAKEVATMMRKSLGLEDYARLLVKVQRKLDTRKMERRKVRTQQFVTDPELAAKKKIARQLKKKEAKKRRMTEIRGKRTGMKKPRRQVDMERE